jgi:hypothetical protein
LAADLRLNTQMPARRRATSWARLAPAILLAGLALPALPVSTQAADQHLSLSLRVGYHGVVKSGQWMPVSIDVGNSGADFQGTIEIQPPDGSSPGIFNPGPQTASVYSLSLTLPHGSVKHLRTYVASDTAALPVTVRLAGSDGRSLTSQSGSSSTAGLLVGVLSDDPTAFDEFAAVRFPANSNAQVVHLAKEDVPASAVFLRAFDLIAIDDFATDSLTPTQRSAIEGYVAMGGSLLLGSGGAWRKTLAALPEDLLPLDPSGTTTVSPSTSMETGAPMEVATGRLAGRAWLSEGGQPLLVEKGVGTGLVTLATFDWTQDPAASSPASRALLHQVGLRSGLGTGNGFASGIGGGPAMGMWYGKGPAGSITQRSGAFIGPLSNLPALDLPSLRLTGLLVLLYVLVVGPLNYLLLLRLGRRELAWITVPVIAVTFAGVAYGLAVGTKGRSVQANQIAILHVAGQSGFAYQETYTGILTPTRGDYSIRLGGPQPAIAPIATAGNGAGTRVHPDQSSVDLLSVTAFTLRGYASESAVPAPAVSASLSLRNGRLSGTVDNASRLDLSDAFVAFGGAYQRLGHLAPGGEARVEATTTVAGVQLVNPFTFPNTVVGQPPGSGSQAARETDERLAILQSLLATPFGPPSSVMTPVLIAWTHDPLQPIQVNGSSPALQSESAVVLPLRVATISSGTIPASVVTGRLVDSSGDVEFGPSSTVLNGASATYELRLPLAPGAQLVNPTITSTNPYGAKVVTVPILPGGSSGVTVAPPAAVASGNTSTMTVEAWNWRAGRWVAFPLQDNATAALPDGCVDASGTVRIRLTAGQGSAPAQMGVLSLGGSVQ